MTAINSVRDALNIQIEAVVSVQHPIHSRRSAIDRSWMHRGLDATVEIRLDMPDDGIELE
jgi:hypothetical protein